MPAPKRRSLRDRLATEEARGRSAFDPPAEEVTDLPSTVNGQPSTDDPQRSTHGPRSTMRPEPPAPSWEETHTRVTFYCPRAVLEAVEAEMARSGRSKSRVIVDALREHLSG